MTSLLRPFRTPPTNGLAAGRWGPYKRGPTDSPAPSAQDTPSPMSQTLELTRNLMARRSVTPADEGCQEVMTARLAAAGFHIEPLRYGSVANFWAKRGAGGPVFCFAG